MFILISAPVYKRAWLLPAWFQAIERQDIGLENIGFQFLTGPNDLSTLHELLTFHHNHPEVRCFDIIMDAEEDHMEHVDGVRRWVRDRYHSMAKFRNTLLEKACCREPDRFLSLDTDILLEDPSTISQLVEATQDRDAVSPLTFMTPEGVTFPNVMNWFDPSCSRAFRRADYPIGTIFESDIIMAVVMMSPQVYRKARYEYHPQGEDVGWSKNMKENGFHLYSASNIYTPHIMNTRSLTDYIKSGDSRGKSAQREG